MDTDDWLKDWKSLFPTLLVILVMFAAILFVSFFLPLLICRLCKEQCKTENEVETDLLTSPIDFAELGFWNWNLETGHRTRPAINPLDGHSIEIELREARLKQETHV